LTKRSLTVAGHRTSVSLEEPFWAALAEIAADGWSSIAALVASIDRTRPPRTNLSSAIRVFVLDRYRKQAPARVQAPPTAARSPSAAGRRRARPAQG
jgi:predicted DNA-binding ribbon-helix-helix protein